VAGSRSFTAIGEWVADAPPHVLASLGIRRDLLTRRFEPPDEATIRRVLESVDAGAFDMAVGACWLPGCTRPGGGEGGRQERHSDRSPPSDSSQPGPACPRPTSSGWRSF